MAFRSNIIDPGKGGGRSEMSQGSDVGDSAVGNDGKVYDWTGERWALAGDQSRATDQSWVSEMANKKLIDETVRIINELEDKLNEIPEVSLSQEELDGFLQKAIEAVRPYYDQKRSEIEAGIKEGKIQDAEGMLKFMRDTKTEISGLLQKYDIKRAETEEDFINTLADITSSRDEDLVMHRDDWRSRIDTAKQNLTQKGTLTSGIGQKDIKQLSSRQQMEEEGITRRYGQSEIEAGTEKKFELDKIQLARQQAEARRLNTIGTPEQQADANAKIRETMGLDPEAPLPTDLEMEQSRSLRNITVSKPEALTDLTERHNIARESKRLTLQQEEEDLKQREYDAQRKKILAEQTKKERELQVLQF